MKNKSLTIVIQVFEHSRLSQLNNFAPEIVKFYQHPGIRTLINALVSGENEASTDDQAYIEQSQRLRDMCLRDLARPLAILESLAFKDTDWSALFTTDPEQFDETGYQAFKKDIENNRHANQEQRELLCFLYLAHKSLDHEAIFARLESDSVVARQNETERPLSPWQTELKPQLISQLKNILMESSIFDSLEHQLQLNEELDPSFCIYALLRNILIDHACSTMHAFMYHRCKDEFESLLQQTNVAIIQAKADGRCEEEIASIKTTQRDLNSRKDEILNRENETIKNRLDKWRTQALVHGWGQIDFSEFIGELDKNNLESVATHHIVVVLKAMDKIQRDPTLNGFEAAISLEKTCQENLDPHIAEVLQLFWGNDVSFKNIYDRQKHYLELNIDTSHALFLKKDACFIELKRQLTLYRTKPTSLFRQLMFTLMPSTKSYHNYKLSKTESLLRAVDTIFENFPSKVDATSFNSQLTGIREIINKAITETREQDVSHSWLLRGLFGARTNMLVTLENISAYLDKQENMLNTHSRKKLQF